MPERKLIATLRALHDGGVEFILVGGLAAAIVTAWLSFDFAVRRLPLRPYFFGGAVTILLATAYLEWFARRERRSLRDLARLREFEDQPEA
jgi:hypothetical protein